MEGVPREQAARDRVLLRRKKTRVKGLSGRKLRATHDSPPPASRQRYAPAGSRTEEDMTEDLLAQLLAAAEAHGVESEPDHEVGDLQQILFSCWSRLTPAQQREVFRENAELVAQWVGGAA